MIYSQTETVRYVMHAGDGITLTYCFFCVGVGGATTCALRVRCAVLVHFVAMCTPLANTRFSRKDV